MTNRQVTPEPPPLEAAVADVLDGLREPDGNTEPAAKEIPDDPDDGADAPDRWEFDEPDGNEIGWTHGGGSA